MFNQLKTFLQNRSRALEASEIVSRRQKDKRDIEKTSETASTIQPKTQVYTASEEASCECCGDKHKVFTCPKFKSLSLSDKTDLIKCHALCFNSLKPGHMLNACKSCKHCGRRHHSLLARFNEVKANATEPTEKVSIAFNSDKSHVLLLTAVFQDVGNCITFSCRALSILELEQTLSQSLVREN